MAVIFAFISLYLLTGIIRFLRDFTKRNVTSAMYVRNPNLIMAILSIAFWPAPSISRFVDNFGRGGFSYFFKVYAVNGFLGLSLYIASISGLVTIFTDELLTLKIVRTIGLYIIFSAVIWWLYARTDPAKFR